MDNVFSYIMSFKQLNKNENQNDLSRSTTLYVFNSMIYDWYTAINYIFNSMIHNDELNYQFNYNIGNKGQAYIVHMPYWKK
jgi:hypothetical protein